MTGLARRPGPTVRTRVEEHVGDEVRRHDVVAFRKTLK